MPEKSEYIIFQAVCFLYSLAIEKTPLRFYVYIILLLFFFLQDKNRYKNIIFETKTWLCLCLCVILFWEVKVWFVRGLQIFIKRNIPWNFSVFWHRFGKTIKPGNAGVCRKKNIYFYSILRVGRSTPKKTGNKYIEKNILLCWARKSNVYLKQRTYKK